jgi:uncharacterized membrane protein
MTRGSITGQVKALSMIVAMQNFIPDRLAVDRPAVSSEKKSAPSPTQPQIYAAAWRATTIDPQPSPAPDHQENQEEDSPGVPEPELAPSSAGEAPPDPGPSQSAFANRFSPSEAPPPAPYVPVFASVPDTRVGFSIKKNPFARPR